MRNAWVYTRSGKVFRVPTPAKTTRTTKTNQPDPVDANGAGDAASKSVRDLTNPEVAAYSEAVEKQAAAARAAGTPKKQVPSIGRTLHYVGPAGTHYPGTVVVAAEAEGVIPVLRITNEENSVNVRAVPYDADGTTPGTWHWPEYVEGS